MARPPLESLYRSAALKALESFEIEPGDIELVAHSENVTFRVLEEDSRTRYALRLHRPGYNSIEELESERMWTKALHEAGISVQDSLLTHQGQHFERVDIPGTSEQRYAGMTTWLEGTPLSAHPAFRTAGEERTRCMGRMGRLAAALHEQSTQWRAPPGFTRQRLDIDSLLGETPRWGRFWEHADLTGPERSMLLQARDNARMELEAYGAITQNFSLIHADLHPDNIICNAGDLSLIDFDDSAYGWHMYDLASMLIEYISAPDFENLSTALLEAYREHRPLAMRDVEILPTFLLVRGLALIGWYHQRPEQAGSEYFLEVKHWVLENCMAAVP